MGAPPAGSTMDQHGRDQPGAADGDCGSGSGSGGGGGGRDPGPRAASPDGAPALEPWPSTAPPPDGAPAGGGMPPEAPAAAAAPSPARAGRRRHRPVMAFDDPIYSSDEFMIK
jgi:hypothetical protein